MVNIPVILVLIYPLSIFLLFTLTSVSDLMVIIKVSIYILIDKYYISLVGSDCGESFGCTSSSQRNLFIGCLIGFPLFGDSNSILQIIKHIVNDLHQVIMA